MFRRNLMPRIVEALSDRPVVTLVGPRQAGKSTLARALVQDGEPASYVTLDDAAALAAATSDPEGFLVGLPHGSVIDEVQRAPGLAQAIKASVDRERRPGRFLLTGSADVMVLPSLADALVGRMEILNLLPLSQGEIEGGEDRFVDRCFDESSLRDLAAETGPALYERLTRGGFPEPLGLT